MKPEIIFQEIAGGSASLTEQRSIAHSLLFELTGKKIKHSKTGRPIIDKSVDVSISHKNDLVCVGIVPRPYRIGVDVEHIGSDVNGELFLKSVITKTEALFLKTFCEKKNISISAGIVMCWSVKEAFFKCLDFDLKPAKIGIADIDKNGKVKIDCSEEISQLMQKRDLELCFVKVRFDERYVYSQVMMKENVCVNGFSEEV